MSHVIYKPKDPAAGGDPREWVFDPGEVFVDEAELIEDHFKGSWTEFVQAVQTGRASALRLLYWYLVRRDHIDGGNRGPGPNLRDVPRFRMGEFTVNMSSAELQERRDMIEGSTALPADQRAMALEAADREIAKALTRETSGPEATGSAPRASGTSAIEPPAVAQTPNGGSEPPAASQAPQTAFEHVEPTAEIISPPAGPTVGERAAEVDRGPLPEPSEPSDDATG